MTRHHSMLFSKATVFRCSLRWMTVVVSTLLLILAGTPSVQAASIPSLVTLPRSVPPQVASATLIGHHNPHGQITISLLMRANNQAQMNKLLQAVQNRQSPLYHHWLRKGEFDARFGPTSTQAAAVKSFLQGKGLRLVSGTGSAFIIRATGTSGQMEAAFHTTINDYRSHDGKVFFANSTNVSIPANLKGVLGGVLGLSNVSAEQPLNKRPAKAHPNYGGGPGGTGLTPSQIAGIYNADPVYAAGNFGQNETLGVFELSCFTPSDIPVYESQFGLPNVPLIDRPVDGGCTDSFGAAEVELDIELQIALAPGVNAIVVYNSPATFGGVVDQYFAIADDNVVDAVSTSWGICELGTFDAFLQAEELATIQMSLQGQSLFAASGDSGAFGCGPLSGGNALQVIDPASQPYVTGVGGTSLDGFDPGSNPNPSYPFGAEIVWNNGCFQTSCFGASGGGVSHNWARPDYQTGPGVEEPGYSQSGAWCLQRTGVACREVPDVSLNADPFTGYSIFCTDPVGCGSVGWLQIGGTSAAAPLWAAIAALTDHQIGGRLGLFNYFLYFFDSASGYTRQFHDITVGDNGYYPAGADYDMATGIGTANIAFFVFTF